MALDVRNIEKFAEDLVLDKYATGGRPPTHTEKAMRLKEQGRSVPLSTGLAAYYESKEVIE
jgi:hypothetical protein